MKKSVDSYYITLFEDIKTLDGEEAPYYRYGTTSHDMIVQFI